MDQCSIPANPDISGIGVRIAIYAQNILCFAPVITHLWDGVVSPDEMKGVMDQSVGMLSIAFAILVSTVVQASGGDNGRGLSSFHAAVILDLSWMNNTSTWIWFLLYIHNRSKGNSNPIPPTWSAWIKALLSPLRELADADRRGLKDGNMEDGRSGAEPKSASSENIKRHHSSKIHLHLMPFLRRAWNFVSQKPVLSLGSLHLSLMSAIGLWLWSNPSSFGAQLPHCNPSLSVVGGSVSYLSSPALRVFSLFMYSLLVLPGINLIPPFLFFLFLHISYNKLKKSYSHLWKKLGTLLHSVKSWLRLPSNVESEKHIINPASNLHHSRIHTAFITVGFLCLVVIDIILLIDVELTLHRNEKNRVPDEDSWGFGQVLALLLLILPLRDFLKSILDIQEKIRAEKIVMQRNFEDHLRQALEDSTFDGHDFKQMIDKGADPNTELTNSGKLTTLFQLVAYQGNEPLAQYLLEAKVKPDVNVLCIAAGNRQIRIMFLLAGQMAKNIDINTWIDCGFGHLSQRVKKDRYWEVTEAALVGISKFSTIAKYQKDICQLIPKIVYCFDSIGREFYRSIISILSELGRNSVFQYEIDHLISRIVDHLKNNDFRLRHAACLAVPEFSKKSEFHDKIRQLIPGIMDLLENKHKGISEAAASVVLELSTNAELQKEIHPAFPKLTKMLRHSDPFFCQTAILIVSELSENAKFEDEIELLFPTILDFLKAQESILCVAAALAICNLAKNAKFQKNISQSISEIMPLLWRRESETRRVAVSALSKLFKNTNYRKEIHQLISELVDCLKDKKVGVRNSAIIAVSELSKKSELQMQTFHLIPKIVDFLGNMDYEVHRAAAVVLSELSKSTESQEEIYTIFPKLVKLLKDSDSDVCEAAILAVSELSRKAKFQEKICPLIPTIISFLHDRGQKLDGQDSNIYVAACSAISNLSKNAHFREKISQTIHKIINGFKDMDSYVRGHTVTALLNLLKIAELQEEICDLISKIVGFLDNRNPCVHRDAVRVLQELSKNTRYLKKIRAAFPKIAELLKGSDLNVFKAAMSAAAQLSKDTEFQEHIHPVIPQIMAMLKDNEYDGHIARRDAVTIFANLSKNAKFQKDIYPFIPAIVYTLDDSDAGVRASAVSAVMELSKNTEYYHILLLVLVAWSKSTNSASVIECASNLLSDALATHSQ